MPLREERARERERERNLCITELAPVDLDDGNHAADISDEDLVGVVQVFQVFERDRLLALSGPAWRSKKKGGGGEARL
jgi:hypothetical protein